jgi:hypothetical protein
METFEGAAEYYLRRGKFEEMGRRRFYQTLKHGTSVVKYELCQPLVRTFNSDGILIETRGEVYPKFTLWPIRDFECTHHDRPNAVDQECVWWIRRGVSVMDLQEDEATWDFVIKDSQFSGYRRTQGKYFNLQALRDMPSSNGLGGDDEGVSNGARFDVYNPEGSISYEDFRDGKFSPDMAKYFGINVNMGEVNPEDSSMMKEFRMRLASVPVWDWACAVPLTSGAREYSSASDATVIQFGPKPSGRNGAYKYLYTLNDEEFFGLGIIDLGDTMERVVDCLVNCAVKITLFNANPAAVVDRSALLTKTHDEIRRMLRPNSIVDKTAGTRAAEFLELLRLDNPPMLHEMIAFLRQSFFDVVGVLPAIMGGATANTLGQDRMNMATAQNRLEDWVIANSKEDYRLITDFLSDIYQALGPDQFRQKMRKIGGYAAMGIEYALEDTERIEDLFYVEHPASFGRDPVIAAAQITQWVTAFMPLGAKIDVDKAAQAALQFTYPFAQELIGGYPVVSPQEEWYQMLADKQVLPSAEMPPDALMEHMAMHMAMMKAIETQNIKMVPDPRVAKILMELDPKQIMEFHDALLHYMQIATSFMRMHQAQAAQQAALQGGQPQGGGGGESSGAGRNGDQVAADQSRSAKNSTNGSGGAKKPGQKLVNARGAQGQ